MGVKITKSREDIIREIRAIGESIIKNAESIAGTEELLREIYIQAEVHSSDEVANISISRSFLPEKCISDAE